MAGTEVNNLIILREKIGLLESKKEQVVEALQVQVQKAITAAEIPVLSNNTSTLMCAPFIELVDKHIHTCTRLLDFTNSMFGEINSQLEVGEFPRLDDSIHCFPSLATSPSSFSGLSSSSTLSGETTHLKEIMREEDATQAASVTDRIKESVMEHLQLYSQQMRQTLVQDISTQVIQHLRSVLDLQDRSEEETDVKKPYPPNDSSGLPDNVFVRSEKHQNPSTKMATSRRGSRHPSGASSGRADGNGDDRTSRSRILNVPTAVIGQAYPPSVLFHGQLSHSVLVHGATVFKCDRFYVLQEEWYEKDNGFFIAPVTGIYRCYIDVRAWYKEKEEKRRSSCTFRLSRNRGKPTSWAVCELTSLWWDSDAKSTSADEEILLHEGEEIYLMASTTIGQWETVPTDVTLMIMHSES